MVRETMKADPFSGAVYVFRAKRVDTNRSQDESEKRRLVIMKHKHQPD
jgi:hypothetical protein